MGSDGICDEGIRKTDRSPAEPPCYFAAVRAVVVHILLLVLAPLLAQDLRFQHLTTEQGLSDNAITCIFEDRAGYIWIGTERGLNRYDGQRVDHFPPGASGPLGGHITSIAEDGRGDLWFSTVDGGISRRHASTGRFEHIAADGKTLPKDGFNHVLVVDDSLLIISSRLHGAIWYHLRKGIIHRRGFRPPEQVTMGDSTRSPESNWIHSVLRLDERRVWICMLRVSGTFVVDARSGEPLDTIAVPLSVTHGLLSKGSLYMGGWAPGMQRVQLDHPDEAAFAPIDDEITTLVEWTDGHLLAGTKVGGLLLLEKDGRIVLRHQHNRSNASSIRSDRITRMLRDRSGNLWVGTSKGVSLHAPRVWRFDVLPLTHGDHAGDLVFHKIQQDEDGTIRISTSKGFILVDPVDRTSALVPLRHNGVPLEVTGLFRTAPDEWFVGTETGMFRYDPRGERILPEKETGKWDNYHAGVMFQTRTVFGTTIAGRERLILGALGYGHIALDPATGERLQPWSDHPDQEGTLMLRSTLKDAQGVCWSATEGGLVRWTPRDTGAAPEATMFNTRSAPGQRLPGDDAQALEIRDGATWVALRDAGLASITNGRATAHVPPSDLPDDALGLTVDRTGNVWCSTGNGSLRYSPQTTTWLHVPVNDGRDFRQLTKCIITLKDGRIALCADDHLLLFDPSAFQELPALPVPRLVGIRNSWGDLAMHADTTLELTFRNSAFDATLTALQPVGAQPLSFLYRLDSEADSSWRSTEALTPVRYSGLPVGNHRLLVRVRDAYGRKGPVHALLAIRVVGPFYQRWWFFALVLAAGALGMYLVSRFRQKQHLRLQGVRDRIARDLHDDIGSTLGSISFYSEALRRKLNGNGDGMTQEVAERIGSSSREMIDRMSDIVWSVDPNKDDTDALIDRLQAFAKDLLSTKDIALRFSTDEALRARKLSAEQRRNLFLICKEALHNAVKYADARTVAIDIRHADGLSITIHDDGSGFDPKQAESYNGNGLVNMRARCKAIGAELDISSTPGQGSTVRLHLPARSLVPRSGD